MIFTPIGTLFMLRDKATAHYSIRELPNETSDFAVDRRCLLTVRLPSTRDRERISCCVHPITLPAKRIIESEKNLALVSFYLKGYKLSIGTEVQRNVIQHRYLNNGIKLFVDHEDIRELNFCIAWKKMIYPEIDEFHTRMAGNPAYMVKSLEESASIQAAVAMVY